MRENERPTSRLSKVIVWQTYWHTDKLRVVTYGHVTKMAVNHWIRIPENPMAHANLMAHRTGFMGYWSLHCGNVPSWWPPVLFQKCHNLTVYRNTLPVSANRIVSCDFSLADSLTVYNMGWLMSPVTLLFTSLRLYQQCLSYFDRSIIYANERTAADLQDSCTAGAL